MEEKTSDIRNILDAVVGKTEQASEARSIQLDDDNATKNARIEDTLFRSTTENVVESLCSVDAKIAKLIDEIDEIVDELCDTTTKKADVNNKDSVVFVTKDDDTVVTRDISAVITKDDAIIAKNDVVFAATDNSVTIDNAATTTKGNITPVIHDDVSIVILNDRTTVGQNDSTTANENDNVPAAIDDVTTATIGNAIVRKDNATTGSVAHDNNTKDLQGAKANALVEAQIHEYENYLVDWRQNVFMDNMLALVEKQEIRMQIKMRPPMKFADDCYDGGETVDFKKIPEIDLEKNNQDIDYGVGPVSKMDFLKKRLMTNNKWVDFITKKEMKRVEKEWQKDLKEELVEANGQLEQISIHTENAMKSVNADIEANRQDTDDFQEKKEKTRQTCKSSYESNLTNMESLSTARFNIQAEFNRTPFWKLLKKRRLQKLLNDVDATKAKFTSLNDQLTENLIDLDFYFLY